MQVRLGGRTLATVHLARIAIGLACAIGPGCRYRFDPRLAADADATRPPDASADAPPGDAFGTCDPAAPFGVPVPLVELNDPSADDGTLRLATDELSGYFWSRRSGNAEIYLATRTDLTSPFTIVAAAPLNTTANEMDPTVTSDGTLIVFRRSGPGDHLYQASRLGPLTFGPAMMIANVDQGTETQSYLQPGGSELYFQSKRSGAGIGDLYRSVRTGTTFATPTRIVELATASEEGDPVITADGLTIYFRSDRAGTNALFNIWTASRHTTSDPFGPATEVPNVSSAGNDGPSDLSSDGCRLYLSSDRAGTNDIYVATRQR